MLIYTPVELIDQISTFLSRNDIYQLLGTCRYLYEVILPHLYNHLEIRDHIRTRQLQRGIERNPLLRETIIRKTLHLTFRSTKSENNWRIYDLLRILSTASQVTTLTFFNFQELSVNMINKIIEILPNLQHVEIKHCILNSDMSNINNNELNYFSNLRHKKHINSTNEPFSYQNPINFKRMSFIWTDLSEQAVLPSLYSQVTHLELGSNHNIHLSINELIAKSILKHCPNVTHLTIALPQVSESILCNIVSGYGSQLVQLSIRCDSFRLLDVISIHNPNLTHLSIRINPSAFSKKIRQSIPKIIESCKKLSEFEIWSWNLDKDVPILIWKTMMSTRNYPQLATLDNELMNKVKDILKLDNEKRTNQQVTLQATSNLSIEQGSPIVQSHFFEDMIRQRYHHTVLHEYEDYGTIFQNLVINRSGLKDILFQLKMLEI